MYIVHALFATTVTDRKSNYEEKKRRKLHFRRPQAINFFDIRYAYLLYILYVYMYIIGLHYATVF